MFKVNYKAKLEFSEGWGFKPKNPSVRGVWIFLEQHNVCYEFKYGPLLPKSFIKDFLPWCKIIGTLIKNPELCNFTYLNVKLLCMCME